jgi:DNA-binding response OmpR family regulator
MGTILIIEDEIMHRTALQENLAKKGFRTVGTADGEEGILLAKKEIPSLIILDILLPKINGLRILELLRENPVTSSIPVVILTAFDSDEYRSKAEELGVEWYFVKTDWKLPEIIEKIVSIAHKISDAPGS